MALERVVVVNDSASLVGGAAKVAISSACGLARNGLSVDFFCGVGPVSPDLLAAGATVHCLGQKDILSEPNRARAAVSGIWNHTAASQLRALLGQCDARRTIVHLHSWTKNLSSSVIHAINASGIPFVLTIHDYFTVCPNGGFFDYQRQRICERRAMGFDCVSSNCDARTYRHKLWRVARQLVSCQVAGLPQELRWVIYVSDVSRNILEPYFAPNTQWFKVSYPVCVDQEPRVLAEQNHDFLFVGRLAPEKGVTLFAEAATRIGVPALVVGEGPERDLLERQWPHIKVLGWRSPDQVRQAMRCARVLVFPSLWYEGQPLVVLEALASGVPVLVGDANAARESVEHNVTGLKFRQGSVDALARAMTEMTDGDKVESMSHAAYNAYWTQPLDLGSHCSELIRVYGQILERVARD